MKTYIKLASFLVFFLAAVNLSYGQTVNKQDSANQQNNAGTEINQQNNAGTDNQQSNAVDTTTHTSQLNGTNEGNFSIDKNGNMIPNSGTEQVETTVGKRKPNEYSSGRSGGQYNNPHPNDPVKPTGKK